MIWVGVKPKNAKLVLKVKMYLKEKISHNKLQFFKKLI